VAILTSISRIHVREVGQSVVKRDQTGKRRTQRKPGGWLPRFLASREVCVTCDVANAHMWGRREAVVGHGDVAESKIERKSGRAVTDKETGRTGWPAVGGVWLWS